MQEGLEPRTQNPDRVAMDVPSDKKKWKYPGNTLDNWRLYGWVLHQVLVCL